MFMFYVSRLQLVCIRTFGNAYGDVPLCKMVEPMSHNVPIFLNILHVLQDVLCCLHWCTLQHSLLNHFCVLYCTAVTAVLL